MEKYNKHNFYNLKNETLKIDKWIDQNGWAGWDPYDIKSHKFFVNIYKLPNNPKTRILKGIVNNIIDLFPLSTRKLFSIDPSINSKSLGLLLSSYCNLYQIKNDSKYLDKATEVADWLIDNKSNFDFGISWGYPFDWYSPIFIPKNTPTIIPTIMIGDGFYRLFEITNDTKYLDICKKICDFCINGLNKTYDTNDSICYSYTPLDDYQVHNTNLFVGEYLTRIGKNHSIDEYYNKGIQCGNFSLAQQQPDGFLPYWGIDQTEKYSNGVFHIDHYHSGYEIRALFGIWFNSGDERYKLAYEKYLKWYINNLYTKDNFPKFTPNSVYPINIHSCSESIYCLSVLLPTHPELSGLLLDSYNWTIDNMQYKDGQYIYMIKNFGNLINKKVKITMFRWAQAWMFLALSQYLLISTKEGEKV